MNRILIVFFLMLNLNSTVYAEEKKCRTFDIACKTKNFVSETAEFQKNKLGDGLSKIKKIPGTIKETNDKLKQRK